MITSGDSLARYGSVLTPPRPAVNRTLWVVQVLVAVQFAAGGLLKVTGDGAMVDLFDEIGAGQWLRYVVGTLEISGAIGLLIPRLCGLAALGLAALMAGAIVTNLFIIEEDVLIPIVILLMSALIARGRWPQIEYLIGKLKR